MALVLPLPPLLQLLNSHYWLERDFTEPDRA
jgi:hypothetical protein